MQIQNGDTTLNVETAGDETAPTLLLLHGITSSRHTWEWFVPTLCSRYHVLSLDFRGHGISGRAPGGYQLAGYVTDVVAVLEGLASAPALVVGHSLGGVTAAALAQRRPELVRAMVLEDPPLAVVSVDGDVADSPIFDAFRLMKATVPGVQAAGMPANAVAQMMAMMPTATGVPMGQVIFAEALVAMAAGLLEVDIAVLDPILDGTAESAFDPAQPIPVPTLILTGDPAMPDTVAIAAHVEPVLAASPLVAQHAVIGAGHQIHDTIASRGEFVREVESFLARF